MVYYNSEKIVEYRSISKNSMFVLVGSNIDGYVNVTFKVFNNFIELKRLLPEVFKKLECGGEWDLKLYEIENEFKAKVLSDNFKISQEGKLIFKYDYMNVNEKIDVYITDAMIHINSYSEDFCYNENSKELAKVDGEINQNFITIILQDKNEKHLTTESYNVSSNIYLKSNALDGFEVW